MSQDFSRILVKGGAGFIGSHLVDRLLEEGFEVSVIDNFSTGNFDNISHHHGGKGFQLKKGDIRDPDLVKETLKNVDAVFHEAAVVSVPLSLKEPVATNEINVTGSLNLLDASLHHNVKRFVFASFAAVNGDSTALRKKEDMPSNPNSPYGMTKSTVENCLRVYHDVYGLETISLRYFNVYVN